MNILVVSESFIVKEAMLYLFKNKFRSDKVETAKNIDINTLEKYDLIFMEINIDKFRDLENLCKLKNKNNNFKLITLDLSRNENLCAKSIKLNIDGYITDLCNEEEFVYIVNKIISGKKFYDGQIIQNTFNQNVYKAKIHITSRENQVMMLVAKGISNKEIGNQLNITEFTVKKHIGSILSKLNFKNRQDIIIYIKDSLFN